MRHSNVSGIAGIVLTSLAVAALLYACAFYSMIEGIALTDRNGFAEVIPVYRIDSAGVHLLFKPIFYIDKQLRPYAWKWAASYSHPPAFSSLLADMNPSFSHLVPHHTQITFDRR